MLEIDGAHGESGGQILRTAVGLSALTGKAVRVYNIRSGRKEPGLKAQHVAAVKAVADLCGAKTFGAEIGSKEIVFEPSETKFGRIEIRIPTAGSAGLVLQGLLIAAAKTERPIKIKILGGATHGKWAASANYIKNVHLQVASKLGYQASLEIERYGYYPQGGAILNAEIKPSKLESINLIERGELLSIEGISHASENLSNARVAERQATASSEIIENELKTKPKISATYAKTVCPGSGIDLIAKFENSIMGSDGLGELRKRAEDVGKDAVFKLIENINSGASLDEHMADQILPYIALATEHGKSKVSVAKITSHCLTNIWLIEKFLPVKFGVKGEENKPGVISVKKIPF